ncbi:MAG TPA: PilC/PilY family type IV pilus protein [Casimicrobiaceae bacterium]|nr:PilC/PilY family type IV pilus protein [Casimicrobiaceae bacterium]
MKTLRPQHPARRALASLLAFLIAFGPISPMVAYASTPLADGPINVNIKAKPNIVFTLDDSTSMQLDFLPDYVVVNSATNALTSYCRSSTGLQACGSNGSATMPQYVHAEWGMPTAAAPAVGTAPTVAPWPTNYGSGTDGKPPVMTSSFNAMFYNPAVTYTAPLKYDGTSFNDMNAGNTASWTQVPADPFLFPAKYVNLQNKVGVGVWCNTDYADKVNNGDGTTISGDHCRINGYAYAAGANGAPKDPGDYNYPYARNAAGPAAANFFANNTKVVWCDPTKMNKTTTVDTSTCQACPKVCPVALVNSPAGCDPGCTNPAECTVCTKVCPVATVTQDDCGAKSCASPAKTCAPKGERCVTTLGTTSYVTACGTVIALATSPSKGKTYDQDANGIGDVCRRNNFTYASGVAGGWTYPSGAYTRQSGSCGAITSASINRHYYRAAVQWCDGQLAVGGSNDRWRGYGKGNCQADKTATYKFPKFVAYGSDLAAAQDNYTNPAFELVELDFKNKKILQKGGSPVTSIDHTLEDGTTITRDVTSDKPETSELVNYANWFAYYRTRMLAAKSVTSLAFSDLTDKFRVGFHTMSNTPATTFLTVNDFKGGAGSQRDLWYQRLVGGLGSGINVPQGNDTPTLDSITRIGDWFMASSGTHPDLTGSADPINLSCQKNYHILFTDGYTNQPAKAATLVGNPDGSVIPAQTSDTMPVSVIDLIPGTAWPNKVKEGATAVDDSLSDYALYYWYKDLRPPAFAAKVSDNNVPATENDPAQWQHMNFAALSLGTEGVLPSNDMKKVEDQITAGTIKWTTPTPSVFRPGVTGVDDLWHAAVAGRSQFVNARDPQELQTGMAAILSEIKNLQAARAGVAFSSVNFTKDNNFIYRVTIEPGWGGTLTKVLIDPKGGGEVSIGTKYHDVLAAQVTPASVGDEPWYDKRNVITWSKASKAAVPFRDGKFDSTDQDTLGANPAAQKKVIDYLRGDRSNEGTSLRNFRVRSQILGDIVNSSPVVVGEAKGQYSDSTDPGYEAFKAGTASRKKMVYVGANDGMLHAFDEAAGTELWAYIPSFVYSSDPDKGLKMLTKKDPFFKHQMFVDSTPVAADVFVGGAWKTVLIGGMGKGGKGYYAVDITDPSGIKDESDAAAKVMWEFTDGDMGYSYGKPLIAKTYKYGWVAIVTSGYENPNKSRIYVLDIAKGTILEEIETGAGADSGLAQISGFVLSFKNQVLEQIYGGDLLGNLWRWDVSSSDTSKWGAVKFAELTSGDPPGSAQSVTIAPQIEVDFANGVDRYVMIGTGRLLHEDDLVTYGDQVQTMYVIRDGTALKMNSAGLPHKPRSDTDFTSIASTDTKGFSGVSVKGWYQDLPKGERIIAPIAAELNLLGFAGSLPPENECLPGLAANIYVRDFVHAATQLSDSSGAPTPSIAADEGAVGMEFVNIYSDTPNDPTLKLAITLGTNGKTEYIDLVKNSITGDHRMSWRLIGQ